MRWFKHKNESLNDPDISDLIDEFGGDGYMVFFGTLELISRNWKQNSDGKVTFSIKFLRKNFKVSSQRLHNIFTFPKFYKRICSEFSENEVTLFCPDFVDLLDNWSDREVKKEQVKLGSCSVVTTPPNIEGEVEGENKKEECKEENLFSIPTDSPKESKETHPDLEEVKKKHLLDFDLFWEAYPKRRKVKPTKGESLQFWIDKIKPEQSPLVIKAAANYAESKDARDGYARDAIRFLKKNYWYDWYKLEQETDRKEGVYL